MLIKIVKFFYNIVGLKDSFARCGYARNAQVSLDKYVLSGNKGT